MHTLLLSYILSNQVTENRIKFAKADCRVLGNCGKSIYKLNLASDWAILSDLDSKVVIPPLLAISQLQQNLLLLLKLQKLPLRIELTSPCKENVNWHNKKFLKYDPLFAQVKGNEWSPHFLVIELRARGISGFEIPQGTSGKVRQIFFNCKMLVWSSQLL